MKKTTRVKLLLYLSPDVVLFDDAARYLYGMADDDTIRATKTIARDSAMAGWGVLKITNLQTGEKGFAITDEHYEFIDKNKAIIKHWRGRGTITPEAVEHKAKDPEQQ